MKKSSKPAQKNEPKMVFVETKAEMKRRAERALEMAYDPSEKHEALCVGLIVMPRGTSGRFRQLAQMDGLKTPEAICRLIIWAIEQNTLCPEIRHWEN